MFWSRMRKIPKRRGKRVFLLSFLDPSSPRIASSSPGPSNVFRLKEPPRLGKLVTSRVSLSSPGRAAMVPSALFSINSREGELRKRDQGFKRWENCEMRERRRRKKRKQSRGATESRPWSFLTSFLVRCSSCDCRLVLFFQEFNVIYVPLGVSLLFCAYSFPPSIIDDLIFLCKVQS